MNYNYTYSLIVVGTVIFAGGGGFAEETADAPIELIRLRQQFQTKVDQEVAPWREKYGKELQKLEDRLIQERRLNDAVAVKKEKESNTGLSSDPVDKKSSPMGATPKNTAELQKYLVDTVWMIYTADDKKSENLIAVYHFHDSVSVLNFSPKTEKLKWDCKSNKDVLIPYPSGDISFSFDLVKSVASVEHMGKKFTAILVGRPNKKK